MSATGTVVVTGASTGIGQACALRLDRAGWTVLAGVRTEEAGAKLAAQGSARLEPLILDVTDADQVAAAAARVDALAAGRGLAGLVNNAGVAVAGPVEALTAADWRHQFDVNFFGQIAVTQALLPALRAARGRIAFMSSIGGRVAAPFFGPYASSKFAIEGLADSLRRELRQFGVKVVVIEPGSIATDIWDKGTSAATETMAAVSPEMAAVYGESMEALTRVAQSTGARGIPADEVAKAVEQALSARRPRARYLVGTDARLQAGVNRVVPTPVFDRIIQRQMGL